LWNSGEILYYKRYVDDIIIICNTKKVQENTIVQEINKIDENLQFKMTTENCYTIKYLDLELKRNNNNLEISIYRKATNTDKTIHYRSNHPYEHKIAAFRYHINRMLNLPITERSKQEELNTIISIATNNGYPEHIIKNLRRKLTKKNKNKEKGKNLLQNTKSGQHLHTLAP